MKKSVERSRILFNEAKTIFPGGVNSPVRAFRSVGGTPRFMERGQGSKLWDVDGNQYIDFCCSWGPLILGHNPPAVVEKLQEAMQKGTTFGTPTEYGLKLGKAIVENNRFIEKMRFVNSGTEAVMSAVRLARGYTQRELVVKFEGCYHGHVDHLMVKAGSGLATFGESSSAGVPQSFADKTLVLPLNDEAALKTLFEKHGKQIACAIIEPIPANNGLLLQDKKYLNALREVCTEHGALLIFDEVISGFRVGFEGAAGHFNIKPDIVTYGKVIGGGLPVGAYGASAEIMSHISPDGPVYQAGTLSANPLAMAAGLGQIQTCLQEGFYETLKSKAKGLVDKVNAHAEKMDYDFKMVNVGSIFWLCFNRREAVRQSAQIDGEKMEYFKVMYHDLLERGVYLGPSGYEVGFVSAAHSPEDLTAATQAFCDSLDLAFRG